MESNIKDSLIMSVCPISRFGNYFVTASGIGNKEAENVLRIYKFDPQSNEDPLRILSQVKVSVAFTSIGWTKYGEETDEHKFGFIVGGHHDGSISLWEASSIILAKENKKLNFGLLQSKKFHNGPVTCIKFNQKPSLFATGSKDIVIVSIEKNLTLESPVKCPSQDDSEITSLSWNDKVPHILASSTLTGVTYIWEMKKTEVFIKIVDQNLQSEDDDSNIKRENGIHTKLLWCNDGVQIIIAYDHPDYAFMTQYHMKQPNAPTAEFCGGHRDSIVDMVKNPNDNNFMLSLGRDDMVTLWSLRSQKHSAHIQMTEKVTSIAWLNKTPDIFISVSQEGNVNYHQVNFSSSSDSLTLTGNKNDLVNELPPRWLFKKSGVTFAFGGKFATFNEKNASNVTIHTLTGNQELSTKMKLFIEKLEKDLNEVLDDKINSSLSSNNREKNASLFWVALKCLYSDNYNELFRVMGFDKTKLQNEVYAYIGKKVEKVQKKERTKVTNINANTAMNDEKEAEKFWSEAIAKNDKEDLQGNSNTNSNAKSPDSLLNEKPLTIQETVTKNINWNLGAEKLIKQSLLIGDLESAVDVALKCGRDAEALLIASAGDKELFNKVKQSFFNRNKDLFIKNIFSSIINGNFESLFEYNVLKDWKEYILYAKTYLGGNEFLTFANNLGDRLSSNPDIYMALVCYILGQNYEKCVDLLYNNYVKETEKINKNDKKNYIQHLFEQVVVIKNVLKFNQLHDKTDKIFSEYCELLISEGLFVEACSYLIKIKNNNSKILTLYDRLYNHCDYKLGNKFQKMQSPFIIVVVKPKIEKKIEKGNSSVVNKGAKLPHTNKEIFENNVNTGMGNGLGGNVTNKKPFLEGENKLQGKSVIETPKLPKPQPFNPSMNRNVNMPPQNDKQVMPNPKQDQFSNTNSNTNNSNFNNVSTNMTSNNSIPSTGFTSKKPILPNKPVNPPIPTAFKRNSNENNEDNNSYNSNSNTQSNPITNNPPMSRTFNPITTPTINPPKPNFNNPGLPKQQPQSPFGRIESNTNLPNTNTNTTNTNTNTNTNMNRLGSPVSSNSTSQGNVVVMSADEENVFNSFENFVNIYNGVYTDENKQKDFYNRASSLFTKLKNHEIKPNLLRLLSDFINLYNAEGSTSDLKKMQLKIQANGWDQNKTWMSCIEKIVNMPRNK